MNAFGFDVHVEQRRKVAGSAMQSAFLKADTVKQLLVIAVAEEVVRQIPGGQLLKIRFEVDTDPPPGFATHTRYLLQPIPFAVRNDRLPDLFAGKMHAIFCRRWKKRVKGRDWYDLVWYAARHPELHLSHLEQRMSMSAISDDAKKNADLARTGRMTVDQRILTYVCIDVCRKEYCEGYDSLADCAVEMRRLLNRMSDLRLGLSQRRLKRLAIFMFKS